MFCSKCGQAINSKDNYCPNCGFNLKNSVNQSINAGDQSFSFIGNNNEISIDKIENKIVNNMQQLVEWDFKVGKKICKDTTLRNSGRTIEIIGFLGSIASLYSLFKDGISFSNIQFKGNLLILFSIIFIIGMCILLVHKEISQKKFIVLFKKFVFKLNLQLLEDGSIVTVKVKGKCPKCGGKVHLIYSESENKHIGICERNPQEHRYSFDYTKYSDK